MIIAFTISILMAGGVYLILQRGMFRIVIGMSLISHATNLIILALGIGAWRGEPFSSTSLDVAADPVPQAFVLTAIVIAMATTTYMLALAAIGRNDDTASQHANEVETNQLVTSARNAHSLPVTSPRVAHLEELQNGEAK